MNLNRLVPVVLAGGSGTRLWPLSRADYPKQFVSIDGHNSLLQQTLQRIQDIECLKPIVITNESLRFLVKSHLEEINCDADIILEPVGRNTAPAIVVAALYVKQKYGPNVQLLVLSADHYIDNRSSFNKAIKLAQTAAEKNKLVIFGVKPTSAHTGYGYIKANYDGQEIATVQRFVEKPDHKNAKIFVETGKYFWNCGIFLFNADTFLSEVECINAPLLESCSKAYQDMELWYGYNRLAKSYSDCIDDSIDYAVMEHTNSAVMITLSCNWSDVGTWDSFFELREKLDSEQIMLEDCSNCEVEGNGRLIVGLGLKDTYIVDTSDALLVAHKDKVNMLKPYVQKLQKHQVKEVISHKQEHRPWGTFEAICQSDRYKVKKIAVDPGKKLSLQMHYHRAEHWIVVSGTAKVTRGDESFVLSENESTYLPIGMKHCLENPGNIPLILIEVQTGTYLGEDDIVRISDVYGR